HLLHHAGEVDEEPALAVEPLEELLGEGQRLRGLLDVAPDRVAHGDPAAGLRRLPLARGVRACTRGRSIRSAWRLSVAPGPLPLCHDSSRGPPRLAARALLRSARSSGSQRETQAFRSPSPFPGLP